MEITLFQMLNLFWSAVCITLIQALKEMGIL